MKRLDGYYVTGMSRLIMAIAKDTDMNELQRLILETRCRIAEEWRGYPKGLKTALVVFDDLCLGYYDLEISTRRNICRERIRQVHESLFRLKCVQELKHKLGVMKSDSEC